jgi:cytidylate kinase
MVDSSVEKSEVFMMFTSSHLTAARFEPAERALRAAIHTWNHDAKQPAIERPERVFVTVSRQPGAGAISFSHRLAERLNQNGPSDWSAWDRELVAKVSTERGIAQEIIEMIPNRHHNWLDDLLQGFAISPNPPDVVEIRAYKQVATVIRALATAGHAIIVGQGGNFITEGMPAAIHLRLVAPLEHRIKCTAEHDKILLHEAAAQLVDIDQRRAEFYRRYWPGKVIAPEAFTMTLNSAELSLDELVESAFAVIQVRERRANRSKSEVSAN